MTGDGGFEIDLVKGLNKAKTEKDEWHAYRKKQHEYSSQDIDVLIDSKYPLHYCAIECKSKQVDVEKTEKENNSTEDKIYFSQAFSKDKNGVSQVRRITEFLYKTGRPGYLAIAYRRGRGRKVHYYGIQWDHVLRRFKEGQPGLPKSFVEENGILLMDEQDPSNISRKTDTAFQKIFSLETDKQEDYKEALNQ